MHNCVYGSIMLKFFLVAHLTYENQWVSLRNKIRTFVFFGTPYCLVRMGGGQHPLTRQLLGYCEGQKTQLHVIFTPRLDYANVGWTQQQCACPLS